jgi:hypothetical protein
LGVANAWPGSFSHRCFLRVHWVPLQGIVARSQRLRKALCKSQFSEAS